MNTVKGLGNMTNRLIKNKKVSLILSLLIAMYAGLAAPALPNVVVRAADSTVGKLFFLFLIAYAASRNIQVALMVAVAFVLTLHVANQRATEFYINNIEKFTACTDCATDDEECLANCEGFDGTQPNYSTATTEAACGNLGGSWANDACTEPFKVGNDCGADKPCATGEVCTDSKCATANQPAGSEETPGGFANYEGFWADATGGEPVAPSVADHTHSIVDGGTVDPNSVGEQVPVVADEEPATEGGFTNFISNIMGNKKEEFSVYPNSGAKYAYSLF